VKGTPGAEFVPEALASRIVRVPNDALASIPGDLFSYQQILLEKQTLDIFESRHADALLRRLGDPEFFVFGVVTEYCVSFAARGLLQRGRRVSIVQDAIEMAELRQLGANVINTDAALAAIEARD
jgi:nicotinamidase/pyrazinamidase